MIDYRENLFIQRRLLIFNMVCMTNIWDIGTLMTICVSQKLI